MKVSLNWLKELIDLPWSVEETVEKLAQLGFPVESVERIGVQVRNVVSVRILSVSKHPNADRLLVAQVTDGKLARTIVCGAPNIASGQVVPCALPGAKLPGGIDIAVSKIRGVESHGMLCSERELSISDDHAGILQLPKTSPLGKEVADLLGGQDAVLEIEVTPNRPDMLNHIGVARELTALSGTSIKFPKTKFHPAKSGTTCGLRVEEKKLCSRYSAKLLHGVKVGPSPDWMVRRLKICGIRSINNIVDITNYVLLEWGHPLHAFDFSKLGGSQIVVRRARPGEKLLALDEKEYELSSADLVIADASKTVAIAGIMGGQDTGVTPATTEILLESAVFERTTVRQTSKRLGLRSESSIRFEKGTDAETAELASSRAAQLIKELAEGKEGRSADYYPVKEKNRKFQLRSKRLAAVLGINIPKPRVTEILKSLNLKPSTNAQGWSCSIPLYRKDLLEEADLIEEVIRLVGYHAIPSVLPPVWMGKIGTEYCKWDEQGLTEALRGLGISETMTSSFCSIDSAKQVGVSELDIIALANPLSQEETILRPTLLPNLLKAVQRNFNHQQDAVALFEIGATFRQNREEKTLAVTVAGLAEMHTWQTKPKPVDVYRVKGIIEVLSASLRTELMFKPNSNRPFLHPHQSFEVVFEGKAVGWGGMLHPTLSHQLGFAAPCGAIEIAHALFSKEITLKAVALPKYPFVERDIAVVIEKERTWDEINQHVLRSGGALLTGAWPFDVFSSGSLEPHQKSLAFRLRLQHADHTLSEAEITSAVDAIKSALQKNCGAQLR